MKNEKEIYRLVDCGGDKPIAMTKEEYQQLRRDEIAGGLFDYLGIEKGTVSKPDLDEIAAWEDAGKPLDKPLDLETKGLEGELKNMEISNQRTEKRMQQVRETYRAAAKQNEMSKGNP